MAVLHSCCFKFSLKTGTMIIGALLFSFSIIFLLVTIGLVAGWEDFDTSFLDDRILNQSNSSIAQELREKLETLKDIFQEEIRPVWKKEFISLYCFLPWYALVNLLLVIAARKEIKILLLLWIAFTVGFLIWSFVLVSIMFGYNTTAGFVAGVGIAQLFNFIIMIGFVLVVFSFYQEMVAQTIKEVIVGREEYMAAPAPGETTNATETT